MVSSMSKLIEINVFNKCNVVLGDDITRTKKGYDVAMAMIINQQISWLIPCFVSNLNIYSNAINFVRTLAIRNVC